MLILEDRMEHVPGRTSAIFGRKFYFLLTNSGTTRYYDDPERPQIATAASAGLKCDTSGSVPIILIPQPSDDPRDPLV